MRINKKKLGIAAALTAGALLVLSGDGRRESKEVHGSLESKVSDSGQTHLEVTPEIEAIVSDVGTPLETTPEMREFAINAVREKNAHTDYEKAKAIYDALGKLHLEYDQASDARPFKVQTAAELFKSKRGHCFEVSELYVSLTRAVGIKSHPWNLSHYNHAATIFEFDEKNFAVDPTEKATLNGKKFNFTKFDSSERRDDFCSEVDHLDGYSISDEGFFAQFIIQEGCLFWGAHKYDEAISKLEKLKEVYPQQKLLDIDKVLDNCRSEKARYERDTAALNYRTDGRNLYNMGVFYAMHIYDQSISAEFRLKDCEKSIHYLESAKAAGYESKNYAPLYEKLTTQRDKLEEDIANIGKNLINP